MGVLDASALIPLAWVGRLDLIPSVLDTTRTTELVVEEVIVEGKRGTAALQRFLDEVEIHEASPRSQAVAELEGIAVADASVVLLAQEHGEALLANDRALIHVARSHGVACWWVTTLLLRCTKAGILDGEEAQRVLYELVDAGMNLETRVYAAVHRKLDALGG